MDSLKDELEAPEAGQKGRYALQRSIKGIVDAGLAEMLITDQSEYLRLTPAGRERMYSQELSSSTLPFSSTWDGKWRMIILDLPEVRKSEREALRYLLKKAGFVCVKNTVWVSPYPFEQFFINIKKDLDLTTEIMIVVTDTLDAKTQKEFLKIFGK